MATDTYSTIAAKLETLTPFDNRNSMSAEWDGDTFVVFSYRTAIATRDLDGLTWINPERYSVTTSRQQNLVRRVWGC